MTADLCLPVPHSSRLNGSMNGFSRFIPRHFSLLSAAATATLLTLVGGSTALAQNTHLWTQSGFEDFEKGTPQGVAIGSDGHLHEGPALSDLLTTPSTFVWSVAVGKNGTEYLGTGYSAPVLRAEKGGKPFTLFETKDLSVQVVRLGPDGALYVATLPSGKVYKLDAAASSKIDEQKAPVVFDASKLDGAKAADGEAKADDSSADEK